ncbi:hypothetical protein [Thiohalorhabdus methylotrophus]|uniref:VIT family protein n=1 Tax=Thiohalorhabdus methylotrophus TaxID=3242694 RepID=A0ABV4TSK4_9GAMM
MGSDLGIGLRFGLNSGVLTTLGLVVGLHAGTASLLAVVGGILAIAVADALSEALGMRMSMEAQTEDGSPRQPWAAAGGVFAAKFAMAASFLFPVLFLPPRAAVLASVVWGLGLLAGLSYLTARSRRVPAAPAVLQHLALAAGVVGATNLLGRWTPTLLKVL